MNIVIVESPAKAKTINKYLGSDYKVLASYGHIRDLPSKDGSVDPENDFAMVWEADSKSKKRISDIASSVKGSDKLFLATDPDREGEAISWHVLDVLKKRRVLKDVEIKRVAFNEITKSAILDAMAHPRDINQELVDAYLARRALDYLVGFTLSPVLWRKLPGSRSAGRVQSVALRLIVQRENEINDFISEEYWSIKADMLSERKEPFEARLTRLDGEKLDKMSLTNEADAMRANELIKTSDFSISSIEKKPTTRRAQPPFTTSTLQQEASRKLGFNASRTMQVAQSLYEGKNLGGETVGLITYMRTDGVQMSKEAVFSARHVIEENWGKNYVPEKPVFYKSKAKNAQEAHEAIRPTNLARRPESLSGALDQDELKLYTLIWKRTIASQMAPARLEQTRVDMLSSDGKVGLRANGSIMKFEGFLKLYQEGRDDQKSSDTSKDDNDVRLPSLVDGEQIGVKTTHPAQHFTEPPPRFSEASLVKKMEELGIGRPSTYASTLSVLRDRNYVRMERNRFIPEDRGKIVTAFLESFFKRYVEYDFTANLEEQLDKISAGEMDWKSVLKTFWQEFHAKTEEVLGVRTSEVIDALNDYLGPYLFKGENPEKARKCPSCDDGQLSLKTSRYGAFIGCSNYPECGYTRQIGEDADSANAEGPRVLGQDPETGMDITVRDGRFGPYIQVGETEKGSKPKRASIPKDMSPADITFDDAVKLISLPREVGTHPETGEMIYANIGRYGPYVQHEKKYGKLSSTEEVFSVGLNRAVAVLAEAKQKSSGPSELKALGNHPDDGEPVRVMDGRYGPYVNHLKVNATIPRGTDPESVTLEQAVEMIAAKAAKPKRATKKKAAPKKKAAAKKPPQRKRPLRKKQLPRKPANRTFD